MEDTIQKLKKHLGFSMYCVCMKILFLCMLNLIWTFKNQQKLFQCRCAIFVLPGIILPSNLPRLRQYWFSCQNYFCNESYQNYLHELFSVQKIWIVRINKGLEILSNCYVLLPFWCRASWDLCSFPGSWWKYRHFISQYVLIALNWLKLYETCTVMVGR